MNKFQLKHYEIESTKIINGKVRLHFITDLHGLSFGMNNDRLIQTIRTQRPDLILVGGDLFVEAGENSDWNRGRDLMETLEKEFPVYYALGNHEQRILRRNVFHSSYKDCKAYLEGLRSKGILLDNQTVVWEDGEQKIRIQGLSLEHPYFQKPFPIHLSVEHMEALLGPREEEGCFEILLAHNPFHGDVYFKWGSDLILSGHYHGGVIRFGQRCGLISPLFHLFPRYCCGRFRKGDQNMLVSPGLGEHTVKLRIHNPRELMEVDLWPARK